LRASVQGMPDNGLLAIDVGGGTQDILLYEEGKDIEGSVKLVLPSQTVVVARRVREATRTGHAVCLLGGTMGGGASTRAVQDHLDAGFDVFAEESAAMTFDDNLDRVGSWGVKLVDSCPDDALEIRTGDVALDDIARALSPFGLTVPCRCAVAVQDHGYSPGSSNRGFRFRMWREFVEAGGDLRHLVYTEAPASLTRMASVQRDVPGALMMDTGAAAVWGSLEDSTVATHAAGGTAVVVNAGNSHTVGFLLRDNRVLGVFEHHTSMVDTAKLGRLVDRLARREITNAEVFDDGGHGACLVPEVGQPCKDKKDTFVAVTGPKRAMAKSLGYYEAVPHGDMMLTGCFGLVAAAKAVGYV